MGGSIVSCILFIIGIFTVKGYETSPPILTVDVDDIFVNSKITLTCLTSSPPISVVWFKTEQGSKQEEQVIAQKWLQDSLSCRSNNDATECYCTSSQVYSCSIKSVNVTNDGQSWHCEANYRNVYGNLQSYRSGVFTFKLILPLTNLTILPKTSVAYPVFNVTSNFTCITSLTRPAASVHWFNDNNNITHLATCSQKNDVTSSELKYISNTTGYSSGKISCVANYKYNVISTSLTAYLSIQVQFPVSKPIVTINDLSASTTLAIREGRLVHLNCSSSGYPQPFYNWTYPDGRATGSLLSISFARNNGNVSCKAFNVMRTLDGTNSAQVTEQINALNINVLYPPVITQLTSNGKNIDMIYSAIKTLRGDNINIVCTSDANPPATVLWRDQPIPSPTLNVTSVQYDAVWTCQASNSMTEYDGVASTSSVTKTVSVSVLYGPGVPIITYRILPNSDERWNVPNGLIRVVVGRTIMCMCSVDSFPASTYTWNTGHEGSIQTIANVTRTTNTTYICTTRNFMDTSFKGSAVGSNSSSVNIDVLYGPASIALKYNNVTSIGHALPVIKGWSFTLLCSAISNPAPRYAWSGPVVQEGDVLIIRNVTNDTNRNVTCRAENTMVDSVGKRVIGTAQVTVLIELLYSPDVQRLQNQTVLLNSSFTVLCNLTDVGNPPASNFSWIRKDNQKVVGTGKALTLNNIGLADEGEYQCNASNRMQSIGNEVVYGLSQSTFFINVEYGAFIQEFKANQSVDGIIVKQGETVELLCDAYGDPEPVVRVMNTTRGNESILDEIKGHEAKYRIQQAQCEYDTGNYTCSANNRYNEDRHLFALFVYCSPRASPFSPSIRTLYRAPYDDVLFTFTIIAYPKPTSQNVVWYKQHNGSWIVLSDPTNFLVTISDDSMQIQLKIFKVQLADYTNYMVNVSNILGSTVEVFTLKAQSKPEVPIQLQVRKTGKTELVVEWIPGFDGGESQTFTIRYKALGEGSWNDIPINSTNYIWTIDGLTAGTKYQIQIKALNKIGNSDWTQEVNITTLVDAVDKDTTTSAIGGLIGGAAGVVLIVAVIVIWIHRKRGNQASGSKYDDLFNAQVNVSAVSTSSEYEAYRVDSQNRNQYETLAETSFHEYSVLKHGGTQQHHVMNRVPDVADYDCAKEENSYVNLVLSNTET